MLTAAKLDWKVLRGEHRARVTIGGVEEDIPNPKSFALIRDSDKTILSPHVGPRYKVIQNHDAFTVFDEFVKAGQMTMETAGSFGNGQHIWGLAKTGHGFDLANGERIESYFLLLQSHLYGYALKAMWTPIRFPGGLTLVPGFVRYPDDASSTRCSDQAEAAWSSYQADDLVISRGSGLTESGSFLITVSVRDDSQTGNDLACNSAGNEDNCIRKSFVMTINP